MAGRVEPSVAFLHVGSLSYATARDTLLYNRSCHELSPWDEACKSKPENWVLYFPFHSFNTVSAIIFIAASYVYGCKCLVTDTAANASLEDELQCIRKSIRLYMNMKGTFLMKNAAGNEHAREDHRLKWEEVARYLH